MRTRKRVKKEKRSERDLLPVAVGGGRAFVSVEDLQKAIEQFLAAWNNDPKPFVWTATVESIVEKLRLRAVVYFVIVNVLVVKVGGIAGGRKSFLTFESIGGRLRDETGCVALEQSQSRAPLRLMVSGQPGRSTRRCSRCGAPGHIQSGGSEDRANAHTS